MKYDFNLAELEQIDDLIGDRIDEQVVQTETLAAEVGLQPVLASVPLTDLSPGDEAVIVEIREIGPVGRRLLDLGLLPKTRIRMVRRAPLGDPTLYELRGYQLCLRGADAACVRVQSAGAGESDHATRP